jgi:hypothetical protein
MRLRTLLLTLIAACLLSTAAAQRLADLLPRETIFALGVEDLQSVSAKLEPFKAEAERLGLVESLMTLLAEVDIEEAEADAALDELTDLGFEELLGREAWLAVSASAFNPLPAVTLLSRVGPEARTRIAGHIARQAPEALELREGDYPFYQLTLDDPDGLVQVVVYAQAGDLVMLSTNPEVLRGVLRQLGGTTEPSLTAGEGFQATLGQVARGHAYSYLDYAQLARVARPFATGFGIDRLVTRLSEALTTAGVSAGVARFTDTGIVNEGWQRPDAAGGDAELYALLSDARAASSAGLRFVPQGAVSYSAAATDIPGWWRYLNSLARAVPELGGDLSEFALSFLGIDLERTLFSWPEAQVVMLGTGVSDVPAPGMPVDNFLGEMVYAIEARDEAAATAGLSELFDTLGMMLAAFTDPMGGTGSPGRQSETVAGVEVTRYAISPGLELSYAVTDGFALIATSQDAMRAALEANAAGGMAAFPASVPQGASSVSVTDTRASVEGAAAGLVSQLQLAAGLGGAQGLDFDAVIEASEALEQFVRYVASRLGDTVSYTIRSPEGIYSYSEIEVRW